MNSTILKSRLLPLVFVGLSMSLLGACSGDNERLRVCPRVGVLYDASRLTLFGPSGAETEENVVYDAEIIDASIRCKHDDDEVTSDVDFRLEIVAGPMAASGKKTFRYFVAVTELNRRVLEKKYYTYEADFDDGITRLRVKREADNIEFSFARLGRPDLYEILIGWDLTPAQLDYNRTHSAFDRPRIRQVGRPQLAE